MLKQRQVLECIISLHAYLNVLRSEYQISQTGLFAAGMLLVLYVR